ncbi:MAG: glycosyltransferase family 4 protein, partial [Desulfuromonadales bacterium]|nr:glycosyltransferase family 4 protein [Desulfuromonadales bacterium]
GGGIRLALNYLSFALCASILAPFVCRERYDIIFVYEPSPITVGLPALVLKKIKSTPVFFWIQDLWPESLSATGAISNERVLKLVGGLVRFIYNGCDRLLIQSPAFAPLIEKQGVHPDKIIYFPNSVEKTYKPAALQANDNEHILPKGFRIVFAGNIGMAQDFETILSAAEKTIEYPEIQWIILGDGRKAEWVREQVALRGLKDNVHLLGRYPLEAMNGYFAQADAMLVTLKKDPIFSTTIPSKIQSYMACGKPIIAGLDGEGGRLVVDSGAGLASPAEDANALAQSVLLLHRMSQERRDEMGRRGRAYCEANFERNMLIDKLEKWMNECVDES